LKMPTYWHKWGDQSRITGDAENSHRTRHTGCI
jgi:hypothetical protein